MMGIHEHIVVSDAGLSQTEKLKIPLLKEMNKAVKMYEKSIK